MRSIVLLLLLCSSVCSYAQLNLTNALQATGLPKAAANGIHSVSDKSIHFLQQKYSRLDSSLRQQSQKMLARMQRKEDKLQRRLQRKDSTKAAALFAGAKETYAVWNAKLAQPFDSAKQFPLKEYIPGIDSLQTAMRFLKSAGVGSSPDKLEAIQKAGSGLQALQSQVQKANDIEAFVKERERQLKEQLQNSGVARQLKSINKEAFYYQQRLREYKEMLNSPEKAEEKILGAVRESKLFQSFMKKHSYLAKLFPTPDNYGTQQALAGLQTRASVQGALQQRFGTSPSGREGAMSGGSNGMGSATGYLQQQMGAAQAQLGKLKEKMGRLGINGGSGDMTMPDFKPNNQHTKSFWNRLEYGVNVQSEGARSIIPATSEGALMVGYKINDKSTVGMGLSYRVGWGHEGLKHITVTNEGVGIRSYVDIKAKGNIWLSGGYEMNYQQSFAKYQELYNLSMWQRSGLIGLTKKYKVGKKENSLQVLWNFLSYQQVPRSQALKFRVGLGL